MFNRTAYEDYIDYEIKQVSVPRTYAECMAIAEAEIKSAQR